MDSGIEKKSFWKFDFANREYCEKAIKNGGIAAMISAAITGIVSALGLFITPSTQEASYMFNPFMLIDFALILLLGIFIFLKSRVAATVLVFYFVISKIDMWISFGKPTGLFTALIFFYFYITAMIATYVWNSRFHNKITGEKSENNH